MGFATTPEPISNKLTTDITSNNERLKQILTSDDPTISDVEKQRIKIAFAEGYLLGNTSTATRGKAAKYLKIVQQVLTIVIFLAIVVSLMASASGSVFR